MNRHSITSLAPAPIPPDDRQRALVIVRPNEDPGLPHIGLVGDTYTILLSGDDTDGRYCLIDMHIPRGGGPPPHRHDFEESFTVLEGQIKATCRGQEQLVATGQTIHIPANAPHSFTNTSDRPARLLCICSPAGQEEFFRAVGVAIKSRTTPPPRPDQAALAEFIKNAKALSPKYRTELLSP